MFTSAHHLNFLVSRDGQSSSELRTPVELCKLHMDIRLETSRETFSSLPHVDWFEMLKLCVGLDNGSLIEEERLLSAGATLPEEHPDVDIRFVKIRGTGNNPGNMPCIIENQGRVV